MPKFTLPSVAVACVVAAFGIALASPAFASEERAWEGEEVTALATRLDELVHEIGGNIQRAESVADAMESRRSAAARATLGALEKATRQLAVALAAGANREATQRDYEQVRVLRVRLSQQATEAGFADPAIDLIVKAREVMEELKAYYESD